MPYRNKNIHAALEIMMDPFYANKIQWWLGTICKATGIAGMRLLSQCQSNCFRWMLGLCESKSGDSARCMWQPENRHPTAAENPDNYATRLAEILQPGVDKVLVEVSSKRQRAWQEASPPHQQVQPSITNKKARNTLIRDEAQGGAGKTKTYLGITQICCGHTTASNQPQ